jgi:hypothetical protein
MAMPSTPRRDLLPGTLDMLVLKTLSVQSMHGYAIARHIENLTNDILRIEEGSLYPALQRMRQKGWRCHRAASRRCRVGAIDESHDERRRGQPAQPLAARAIRGGEHSWARR